MRTGQLRFFAALMYCFQIALPALAVYVLLVRIVSLGMLEQNGSRYVDILLLVVCAPYSIWFAFYALGGFLGLLGLPFGSPANRFLEGLSQSSSVDVRRTASRRIEETHLVGEAAKHHDEEYDGGKK